MVTDNDVALFEELARHATQHDLLSGRAHVPGWPNPEGWRGWLLSLDEPTLCDCERLGLHHNTGGWRDMPGSLRSMCEAVRLASTSLRGRRATAAEESIPAGADTKALPRRQKESKAAQVQALVEMTASRIRASDGSRVSRVVDVGCGRGHLIAELQRLLGVPALGIDRDGALLESARGLYPSVAFEAIDVMAGQLGPMLREGDLVVGLHPCGLLGERIIEAVAANQGASLLMVPCCLHKQVIDPPTYHPTYPPTCLPTYLPVCLPDYLPARLSTAA